MILQHGNSESARWICGKTHLSNKYFAESCKPQVLIGVVREKLAASRKQSMLDHQDLSVVKGANRVRW